jgi:N-acetylneuraminate synthase/N,N'-diacetyllegionaminate synthase
MLNKDILNNVKNNNKVFIIAEAGSNHLRSLNRAYKLIDIAKDAGADAIKFQSFTADEIATTNSRYNKINKKFRRYSDNLHSFYKKFELPQAFNIKLFKYCKKKKIIFLTSVFGEDSLNLTKSFNPIIKIASFESNFFELFEKIIKLRKPMIISTGCSHESEIKKIKNFFTKKKYTNYAIMHCGSSYPLKFNQADLSYIYKLKKIFPDNLIGYSDHTLNISSSLAAVAMGAKIIEKHFTISKKDSAPDSFFSIEKKELKEMVRNIREIEQSIGQEKKIIYKEIQEMRLGRRSYYANYKYKKGTRIRTKMFKALRPYVNNSVTADKYLNYINKKLKKNIDSNEPLMISHVC